MKYQLLLKVALPQCFLPAGGQQVTLPMLIMSLFLLTVLTGSSQNL